MQEREYPQITADDWRRAMGTFPSGVTIVACVDPQGQPWGMTVASFCSLSMNPPLLLACMDENAPTLPHVIETGNFSVNILGEGQGDLSDRFAVVTDGERFHGISWHPGPGGSPMLNEAQVAIDCYLENRFIGGDHSILIGRPIRIEYGGDMPGPLLYWSGGYRTITP